MKPECDFPKVPDGDQSMLNMFVTFDTDQSEIPAEESVKTPHYQENLEARKQKTSPGL